MSLSRRVRREKMRDVGALAVLSSLHNSEYLTNWIHATNKHIAGSIFVHSRPRLSIRLFPPIILIDKVLQSFS